MHFWERARISEFIIYNFIFLFKCYYLKILKSQAGLEEPLLLFFIP